MVSQCGADAWLKGLASGDLRPPTGSGSTLEALRDDALYKSTLIYFTFTAAIAGYTHSNEEIMQKNVQATNK